MSEKIKLSDIDNGNKILKMTDLENMFSVHLHRSGRYMFNLNETLYFSANTLNLPFIVCEYPQYWSTMSYNIYSTTRLAWLLMKLNNINADNVFKRIEPGDIVRYINIEKLQDLIDSLQD